MVRYLSNRICVPQQKVLEIYRVSLSMRSNTEVSLGSVSILSDN
jgi:hypothetical protein